MWEYIEPLIDNTNLWQGEASVEQCVTARLQEYDGTIFFCCSLRHGTDQHVYTGSSGRRAAGKGCPEVQRGCGPQNFGKS